MGLAWKAGRSDSGSCLNRKSLASLEECHLLLYSLSEVNNKQTIEESFNFFRRVLCIQLHWMREMPSPLELLVLLSMSDEYSAKV